MNVVRADNLVSTVAGFRRRIHQPLYVLYFSRLNLTRETVHDSYVHRLLSTYTRLRNPSSEASGNSARELPARRDSRFDRVCSSLAAGESRCVAELIIARPAEGLSTCSQTGPPIGRGADHLGDPV